jgi:hypothetical protein
MCQRVLRRQFNYSESCRMALPYWRGLLTILTKFVNFPSGSSSYVPREILQDREQGGLYKLTARFPIATPGSGWPPPPGSLYRPAPAYIFSRPGRLEHAGIFYTPVGTFPVAR